MFKRSSAIALALIALCTSQLNAQIAVPGTVEVLHYLDSGEHANMSGTEAQLAFQTTYSYPAASSLRVIFGQWALGSDDFIEVRSVQDGHVHRLNNSELIKWQGSSAYFNGDSVEISLWVAPGSAASFETYSYIVGLGGSTSGVPVGIDSQCGATDDRVTSTDNRSGRFSTASGSAGCTIWLASSNSVALSAGHCFSGGTLAVAEFNVPISLSSGAVQHPPIDDQFPVDASTISFTNGGIGNDWGVCQLFTNNLGQTAPSRYGFFNVTTAVPTAGDTIRVTGYGTDTGAMNQTLQTHSGPLQNTNFVSTTQRSLNYQVDTTGGNSGSPVLHEVTGEAIGIHTHAGCNTSGSGGNNGTHTSHAAFQTAFTALASTTAAAPVANFSASATTVLAGGLVQFTDNSSNQPSSWAWDFNNDSVVDSTAANPSFAYISPGTYSVSLTVTNALGSDTLLQTNLITVNAISPTSVPYSQDFNSGLPGTGEWVYQSIGATGRIYTGQSGTVSPLSGGDALIMDSSTSAVYATNDATLLIDLATPGGGVLKYWFKETLDEDDIEDGVFLSNGVTEIQLQAHTGTISDWTEYVIDLGQAAAGNGMTLTTAMRIIFRQRDNYPVPTDGHFIDDVAVLLPPVTDSGQPNLVDSGLTITGMLDQSGFAPIVGQNGPFFVSKSVGDQLQFIIDGPPNGAFQLFAGPLNRANYLFPGVGQLDIGLLGGSGNFSDISQLIDGTQPNASLLNIFGILGSSGTAVLNFQVPYYFASGPFTAFQAVTHLNLRLTAAVELSIN